MAGWQYVLGAFFVLLPMVLMLDFWGDERVDSRGRPIPRDWYRQIHHDTDAAADVHGAADVEGSHGDLEEAQAPH